MFPALLLSLGVVLLPILSLLALSAFLPLWRLSFSALTLSSSSLSLVSLMVAPFFVRLWLSRSFLRALERDDSLWRSCSILFSPLDSLETEAVVAIANAR